MSEAAWELLKNLGQSAIAVAALAWLAREILKHWLSKDVAVFKEELAHQSRLAIERGKWRNQLRLAELDQRLRVHQEAFSFWHQLRLHLDNDNKIFDLVKECQEWWPRNCLYLSAEAREAFNACVHAAASQKNLRNYYHEAREHNDSDVEEAKIALSENRKIVRRTGKVIVNGVDLPGLGEEEFLQITEEWPDE